MLPAVRDGECVTVAPIDARDVALGDVILCRTWRGPMAHRVLGIDASAGGARWFSTRGDASDELDRPVAAPAVRGRLVSVERDGRTLSLAVSGGWVGRRTRVAMLQLRAALAVATRAVAAAGRATAPDAR